jgi:hypothetical protein
MNPHSKTASRAGLTVPVVSIAVAASSYQNRSEIATAEYAAVKVATQFRLTISTARLVCQLSGLGVGQ